ncbi:hypothetical protein [Streptomyces sp. NPDC090445]|uniref:hypothetical protein n=1 Tax=Streptomyces sp. NPDC090445 TaxID=3365963 RepID=UPI00380D5C3A
MGPRHRSASLSAVLLAAALSLASVSCEKPGGSHGKGTSGESGKSIRTPSVGPKSPSASPSGSPKKSPSPGQNSSPPPQMHYPGSVQARFVDPPPDFKKGDIRVTCPSVRADLTLEAHGGTAAWKAVAVDKYPGPPPGHGTGKVVPGVSFEPSSGILPLGQRRVVHMRGSFQPTTPRREFFVVLEGADRSVLHFTC